jgi:integrase
MISCRISGQNLPPELQRWIEGLPDTLIRNFVKWGLLDGQRAYAGKLLSEHIQDWRQDIIARGKTQFYADGQHYRVSRIFATARFNFFTDISASKLQQEISKLKTTVKVKGEDGELIEKVKGDASQTTKNYYLKACQQFCRWIVKDGRVLHNPLEHLSPSKAQRQKRAALELDEVRVLLAYTEAAEVSYGLAGYQRAMLYHFAAETGFRASEIRALKVSDFDFRNGHVTLDGQHTKNRQDAQIPLKTSTAEKLKVFFRGKLPETKAFKLPYKTNMARMLRKDLEDAGIEVKEDRGKVDFHGLRHTFGTMLAAAGTHPKAAQLLMRHSDINLTMSRYTHVLRGQELAAINSLPDLDRLPESQKQRATGTDNKPVDAMSNLLPLLLPKSDDLSGFSATNLDDKATQSGSDTNPVSKPKSANLSEKQGISEMGRSGFEPPTHGFSVRCSTN